MNCRFFGFVLSYFKAGIRHGQDEEEPSKTFRCLVPLGNLAGIPT